MDDLLKEAESIYADIERKKDLLLFMRILGNEQLKKECKSIYLLQSIINQCIQIGNYRRAARYLLVLKKIKNHLENEEEAIHSRITHIIVE